MLRWIVCLGFLLVGCTTTPQTSVTPTPVGPPSNRPGAPTISAAATRVVQAGPTDAPVAVVDWFLTAYRAGRAVEPLAMLTTDYSDQLRITGGLRTALGTGPDEIREVKLKLQPGGTPEKTVVEAVTLLNTGDIIFNFILSQTPQGWRIIRIETTG